MKISVTQEHINSGNPKSCGSCPIALAATPLFPEFKVQVGRERIFLYEKNSEFKLKTIIQLPLEAINFIGKFDTNVKVDPFEFEVNL